VAGRKLINASHGFFYAQKQMMLMNADYDNSQSMSLMEISGGKSIEREKLTGLSEEDMLRLFNVLEQRIVDRTMQMEAANKELEAFGNSISHDLRTPLRHIKGFTEILINDPKMNLSEEANRYLEKISASAQKMEGLIDDLLNFSKTGSLKFIKSEIKMSDIVADALMQIKPFTAERRIEWNISLLPAAYGNYSLLRQVWINLLDNAVKYTRTREKAVINIGFREEAKEMVFYIQDNGVGFDMQFSEKLFGVFQRMHLQEQFEGTGIGLANVRRIITRHGGRTWADAEVDKGAIFFFSLPFYPDNYLP
jgi:light-regulated signal transduction histidine kinase (bacteriophytochrome)